MLRVEKNDLNFQSTLCGLIIKIIGTQRVDRHQAPCLSGVFPQDGDFMTLYTPLFARFIARCEMFRVELNGLIFESTLCV